MNTLTFETSKEAYDHAVTNGLISKRLAEVLAAIVKCGEMNQTETTNKVMEMTGNHAMTSHSITPRFSTLVRMGLLEIVGKAPCSITGRLTTIYRAALSAPLCTQSESKVQAPKRETISELTEKNRQLEDELRKYRELEEFRLNRVVRIGDSVKREMQMSFV
jgi:polyhydroxyalkanoate synthesis regulator phasin